MRARGLGLVVVLAAGCGGATRGASAVPEAGNEAASCARRRPGVGALPLGQARQGGAVALGSLGDAVIAYVADEDDHAVRAIDVGAGVERGVTRLPGSPAQVMILADGRIAVTLRDRNRVAILEPASADPAVPLEERCSQAVAVEPVGLAATPDDQQILVTSAWGRKLTALDARTLAARFDADLPREPRAVVVDDDGQRAFVAHVVGAKMSVVDLGTDKHEVRGIDLKVTRSDRNDGKRRAGCQGFALAKAVEETPKPPQTPSITSGERPPPDLRVLPPPVPKPAVPRARGRIFAPMVTVDPGETTARSSGYGSGRADTVGSEAPIVSVIDGGAERPLTRSLVPSLRRHDGECLLPRAAAVSADGESLFVTCLGLDAVVELDARGLDPARLERRRWSVPAGPTGVALDDRRGRLVVWSAFDRKLSVIDRAPRAWEADVVSVVTVAALSPVTPAFAWGRRLFHQTDDTRISRDGRACASCHPDGREDALTWSTPEGPRQTIMLAGRLGASAPYGWNGAHESLEVHVRTTLRRLEGSGLPVKPGVTGELEALDTYLVGMRGPVLEGAAMDPGKERLAERGKVVFDDPAQGCATCHVGGRGTDQTTHDVGSALSADRGVPFDTPSLRFVSGTAPYFHDGRYATLRDLLSGSDGRMGHTLQLKRADVVALEAYLETL
jgi:DNA-binding beta-propeller fold protein YncE/mono/diheme cytochrome c family protein